jgi:hypothetical protein
MKEDTRGQDMNEDDVSKQFSVFGSGSLFLLKQKNNLVFVGWKGTIRP